MHGGDNAFRTKTCGSDNNLEDGMWDGDRRGGNLKSGKTRIEKWVIFSCCVTHLAAANGKLELTTARFWLKERISGG